MYPTARRRPGVGGHRAAPADTGRSPSRSTPHRCRDVRTGSAARELPTTSHPAPSPTPCGSNYQDRPTGQTIVSWDNGTQAWLAVVDSNSGEVLREVDSVTVCAVGPPGESSGATTAGDIAEFDPVCHRPGRQAGRARGADGDAGVQRRRERRLVGRRDDGTVQVYDTDGWARVGDRSRATHRRTSPRAGSDRTVWRWPSTASTAWSSGPSTRQALAEAACGLAGRNMTRTEWATYMPEEPYGPPARSYSA